MGVFQDGGLPPHSFCRQIYHLEVKGGPPTVEGELQYGRGTAGWCLFYSCC